MCVCLSNGFYSSLKKNEIMLFTPKCMQLHDIMSNKPKNDKLCMFSLTCSRFFFFFKVSLNVECRLPEIREAKCESREAGSG